MIWFRHLQIYRLAPDHGLNAEKIATDLARRPHISCGSQDLFSQGWVPPAPHMPDLYAVAQGGAVLVCLKTEEKILPSSVVKQQAEERIAQIEAEENRKIGRREAKEMREQITMELLPRAFVKTGRQRALIDLQQNLIIVESGSAAKAENLLSILRETIGSLPSRLIQTQVTPQTAMTNWLESGAPAPFALDADCELKFPGDGGAVARFSRQNLDADEVKQHLASGKLATRLGLEWQERIAFQLTEKLEIKRLTMLETLQENIKDMDAHDQAALFDASLALAIGEWREFIPALIETLGGELA